MKITKETVKAVVAEMKSKGISLEDIENNFKDALRLKMISVDIYYDAMKEIYK